MNIFLSPVMYLYKNLDKSLRLRLKTVLIMSFFYPFIELVTLGSVIPLVGSLTGDENFEVELFGFKKTVEDDLVFLGFFILVLLSTVYRLYHYKNITFFTQTVSNFISVEILVRYLNQNYGDKNKKKSHEISSLVAQKAALVVNNVILPSLNGVNSIFLCSVIFIVAVIFLPYYITLAFLSTALIYLGFVFFGRRRINKLSVILKDEQTKSYRYLTELCDLYDDIKIYMADVFFTERYKESDKKLKMASAQVAVYALSPKFYLEGFAILSLAVVGYFIAINEGEDRFIEIVAILVLGTQRILPHSQQIFTAYQTLSANKRIWREVVDLIGFKKIDTNECQDDYTNVSTMWSDGSTCRFLIERFDAGQACTAKIHEPIVIDKGNWVWIKGSSGVGKSTLLRALAGHTPKSFIKLTTQKTEFAKLSDLGRLSFVFQDVCLFEDSIYQNIVLGSDRINENYTDDTYINPDLLDLVEICKLSDFCTFNELKIKTIKDSGRSVSGGQRQRIGLARALYFKPDFLLLDESLSGVSFDLEIEILEQIKSRFPLLTVLFVSHRDYPSTIFDREILL